MSQVTSGPTRPPPLRPMSRAGRARSRRRPPSSLRSPARSWVAVLFAVTLGATGCSSSSSGGGPASDVAEAGDAATDTGTASDTPASDGVLDGVGDADGSADAASEVGEDADAGGPSISQACASQAAVYCGRAQECRPGAFLVEYGEPQASTTAACETVQRAICEASAELPESGYDVAVITACASALVTVSCADFNGLNTWPCPPPRGRRVNGAECALDAQCASGYCRHWFAERYEACGRCADRLAAEASCADDPLGCSRDAYCESDTMTCQARGAIGDECDTISACTWRCDDGQCAEPAQVGDGCELDADCDFYFGGQTCLEGECALADYRDPSETCDTRSARCAAAACIGGECIAYVGLDDPCGGEHFCGPGLGCNPTTSTCQFAPWLSVCD